eukprot:CAMPEP_0179019034 /NCGR_PEP_ID=MMETSP0796-20121207/4660_1 /TAXON_ID=73915 /ORGANISM="Pyrodinium bahamense, Strain pbaha01" /LENGTH=310 /DNA_ID=CAMNT_0020714809 /DNA_START=148 /DNA_END=1077 /DNA_ORIENTATION=+
MVLEASLRQAEVSPPVEARLVLLAQQPDAARDGGSLVAADDLPVEVRSCQDPLYGHVDHATSNFPLDPASLHLDAPLQGVRRLRHQVSRVDGGPRSGAGVALVYEVHGPLPHEGLESQELGRLFAAEVAAEAHGRAEGHAPNGVQELLDPGRHFRPQALLLLEGGEEHSRGVKAPQGVARQNQAPDTRVEGCLQLLQEREFRLHFQEEEVPHHSGSALVNKTGRVPRLFVVVLNVPVDNVEEVGCAFEDDEKHLAPAGELRRGSRHPEAAQLYILQNTVGLKGHERQLGKLAALIAAAFPHCGRVDPLAQ